jgi:hypothetical protein
MRPTRSHPLARRVAAALVAGALAACSLSCGGGSRDTGGPPASAVDQKIERLLGLILEVEQRGGNDSLEAHAQALIAELGGRDSTADLLASRLLDNSARWIPILDSLARTTSGAPTITSD